MNIEAARKSVLSLLRSLDCDITLQSRSHPQVSVYQSPLSLDRVCTALSTELGLSDSYGRYRGARSTETWMLAGGRLHVFTAERGRTQLMFSRLRIVEARALRHSLGRVKIGAKLLLVERASGAWCMEGNPMLTLAAKPEPTVTHHSQTFDVKRGWRFEPVASWKFGDLAVAADFVCALEATS